MHGTYVTRLLVAAIVAMTWPIATVVSSAAQDYPSRAIRFIHGNPAGGNGDVIARALGDELVKALGQPVIIEARPGASGNIAAEQVSRMQPDGYTIMLVTTAHVISPALLKSLRFDAAKDFDFISKVADFPFFVAVHATSPFRSIMELIDAARAKPDALTWGSAGVGGGQHMCGELMLHLTRTKARHVPFAGDAGSVTALLSRSIDYIIAPSTVLVGNIQGGNFRALAISAKTRASGLPDVPTMTEALGVDIEMQAFHAILAPKGLPGPILERLSKEVRAAAQAPGVAKRLTDMGGAPSVSTPTETAAFMAAQVQRWKEIVAAAGIRQE